MAERVETQCKGCKRAIYAAHLDRDGYCCFCAKPAATALTSEDVKAIAVASAE